MIHYVTSSKASAELCRIRVSKALGYPRAPSRYVGCRAEDLPPGFGTTLHAFDMIEHPKDKLWATLVVDLSKDGDAKLLTKVESDDLKAKLAAAVELDETWKPAEFEPDVAPVVRER